MKVDLGIFAHDEGARIAAMVAGVLSQRHDLDLRVLVLANGCRDNTAAEARAAGAEVAELEEGGKSRTWNRFVHDLSRPEAAVLIFADADITLTQPDALARMVSELAARPALWVVNSRPVKDIALAPPHGLTARLIARAGGTLEDWRRAICGQLYAMPSHRARAFHLPVGLPVEDGFLRAMVLTDALERPEDFSRIDGTAEPAVFHVYESERSLAGLIRHQVRIVIGSALNMAAFQALRDQPAGTRQTALAEAARTEDWLSRVARARLPRAPDGFVPLHFLTKRSAHLWRQGGLRRVPLLALGFAFDLVVYLLAQIRMARGTGAGFW